MEHACLEWYPELDKRLGPSLAGAREMGWMMGRDFEHARVWIDLEAKEARSDWR